MAKFFQVLRDLNWVWSWITLESLSPNRTANRWIPSSYSKHLHDRYTFLRRSPILSSRSYLLLLIRYGFWLDVIFSSKLKLIVDGQHEKRSYKGRREIDVEFHFYYILIRISWFKSSESSPNISLHLSPLNSSKIRIEDTTIGATYSHNEH